MLGGSWADSSSSCRAHKSWWWAELMSTVAVGDVYSLHMHARSFANRSEDGSQFCHSSINMSWQCSVITSLNTQSYS